MAKQFRLNVPDGEYGSDVEGFKPILFDDLDLIRPQMMTMVSVLQYET